jgi:hypothetical protein
MHIFDVFKFPIGEILMLPEPIEIKDVIKRMMEVMDEKLAVWYGNKLQSYIYREVRGIIDWRSFLELMSRRTDELLKWVKGEVEWEELLNIIYREVRERRESNLDSFLV